MQVILRILDVNYVHVTCAKAHHQRILNTHTSLNLALATHAYDASFVQKIHSISKLVLLCKLLTIANVNNTENWNHCAENECDRDQKKKTKKKKKTPRRNVYIMLCMFLGTVLASR